MIFAKVIVKIKLHLFDHSVGLQLIIISFNHRNTQQFRRRFIRKTVNWVVILISFISPWHG